MRSTLSVLLLVLCLVGRVAKAANVQWDADTGSWTSASWTGGTLQSPPDPFGGDSAYFDKATGAASYTVTYSDELPVLLDDLVIGSVSNSRQPTVYFELCGSSTATALVTLSSSYKQYSGTLMIECVSTWANGGPAEISNGQVSVTSSNVQFNGLTLSGATITTNLATSIYVSGTAQVLGSTTITMSNNTYVVFNQEFQMTATYLQNGGYLFLISQASITDSQATIQSSGYMLVYGDLSIGGGAGGAVELLQIQSSSRVLVVGDLTVSEGNVTVSSNNGILGVLPLGDNKFGQMTVGAEAAVIATNGGQVGFVSQATISGAFFCADCVAAIVGTTLFGSELGENLLITQVEVVLPDGVTVSGPTPPTVGNFVLDGISVIYSAELYNLGELYIRSQRRPVFGGVLLTPTASAPDLSTLASMSDNQKFFTLAQYYTFALVGTQFVSNGTAFVDPASHSLIKDSELGSLSGLFFGYNEGVEDMVIRNSKIGNSSLLAVFPEYDLASAIATAISFKKCNLTIEQSTLAVLAESVVFTSAACNVSIHDSRIFVSKSFVVKEDVDLKIFGTSIEVQEGNLEVSQGSTVSAVDASLSVQGSLNITQQSQLKTYNNIVEVLSGNVKVEHQSHWTLVDTTATVRAGNVFLANASTLTMIRSTLDIRSGGTVIRDNDSVIELDASRITNNGVVIGGGSITIPAQSSMEVSGVFSGGQVENAGGTVVVANGNFSVAHFTQQQGSSLVFSSLQASTVPMSLVEANFDGLISIELTPGFLDDLRIAGTNFSQVLIVFADAHGSSFANTSISVNNVGKRKRVFLEPNSCGCQDVGTRQGPASLSLVYSPCAPCGSPPQAPGQPQTPDQSGALIPEGSPISAGAIAGIVIGVLVVAIVATLITLWKVPSLNRKFFPSRLSYANTVKNSPDIAENKASATPMEQGSHWKAVHRPTQAN